MTTVVELADRLRERSGSALLVGGTHGLRKSIFAELADALAARRTPAAIVSTDLGLPLLGPPGAVSRGSRHEGRFRVERIEALATLDAARFRLPLVLAARRVLASGARGPVLIEASTVRRGMAGAELLLALIEALAVRTVVRLESGALPGGFEGELLAGGVETVELAAGGSHVSSPRDRARDRTRLWEDFLAGAEEASFALGELPILGAPPPRELETLFDGRQIGLLDGDGGTLAFGEIRERRAGRILARVRRVLEGGAKALLVRDARRGEGDLLGTDRAHAAWGKEAPAESSTDLAARSPAPGSRPRPPVMTLASAKALLVNGIFGDPLLHVRLRHRKRSLLFDLGDSGRLSARIVHQVSHVFVTHAHFDHIGGFLWFLRSSIASPSRRVLFGPPGLTSHLEGMMAGILWDRIGERGPVFEAVEVHSDRLARFRLQAGRHGREPLGESPLQGGLLLEEPDFRVRTTVLDHGIPVLAFALEEPRALHVRPDRLAASGLAPGPWLTELKRLLLADRKGDPVALPGGGARTAGELEAELVFSRPGGKLVYATDFDDSEENHRRLVELARGARILFCEASFLTEDRHLAKATQHLTARSCGRIALSAGVEKLVPFHFSKRYENDPWRVYREILEVFPRTVVS